VWIPRRKHSLKAAQGLVGINYVKKVKRKTEPPWKTMVILSYYLIFPINRYWPRENPGFVLGLLVPTLLISALDF
jgi:hypothetical protein